MAISARLSRTIHRTLGDEAGEDLVNWMGQVEANRSELRELMEAWAARTDGRFDALSAKTDQRFDAVDSRFEIMSARIDARFEAMAANFNVRFAKIETRIEERFSDVFKWSIAFWFAGIGAMAALLRLMR